MTSTLVLTRTQLRGCVDLTVLAGELRQAMTAPGPDALAQRVRATPSATVTAMVLVPGVAADVPAYTVKVHAKNPDRRPALTGVICLHDAATGDLLAVMDSGWLTGLRTGVGAALGAHVLARADAATVGVVGAGVQGRAQLDALAALRRLEQVHVHDVDPAAAAALAEHARNHHGIPATVSASAPATAAACDLLLIATWARTPVLTVAHIVPGTHVTSLGADEPGKVELDHDLLARALVVTDDQGLADRVLPRTDTTLGHVLRGEHPGRQAEEQITVYSPVGLPLQDCVIAWHVYRKAVAAGMAPRSSPCAVLQLDCGAGSTSTGRGYGSTAVSPSSDREWRAAASWRRVAVAEAPAEQRRQRSSSALAQPWSGRRDRGDIGGPAGL